MKNARRLTLLAILLLAAFLRFYRLDAQSFWNDEGNSARLSERSLELIIEGTASDIHPPAYYVLLHYWRALFGQSEFALRSLSAVAGLALVLFTYLLGRALFGEATGLMTAFLGAISPLAVYYSQEARMYALLTALATASAIFTLRFTFYDDNVRGVSGRRKSRSGEPSYNRVGTIAPVPLYILAPYILTSTLGLYTHYAFAFVLIAHNVVFGLWWLIEVLRDQPRWRRLATWVGAQAAMMALYAPWLPIALDARGWSAPRGDYELGAALLDVLRVLTVGITQPMGETAATLIGAGALLIAGLWPGKDRPALDQKASDSDFPRGVGVISMVLYLLIPLALFFAFDLYRPAWLKFLVILLAPFHILIAHGVKNLTVLVFHAARFTPYVLRLTLYPLLILAAILAVFPSLHNLYFDPAYARDDYRQIATDIQAMQQPGDAIILNAPNQWEVFTYYYPDRDVYPAPYHPSSESVERFLRLIIENHERLFVLYWGDAESDPRKRIESWLASHAYKSSDRWYGDVRLALYGTAPLPGTPDVALNARFGEGILLRGYALEEGASGPGDIVPVSLFWEALREIDAPYKVTVQVLDDAGQIVGQVDTVPRDGLEPIMTWEPGHTLVDRYGIHLPGDVPRGRHALIVAIYHASSGERLPVTRDGELVGDYLMLGEVEIEAESASDSVP